MRVVCHGPQVVRLDRAAIYIEANPVQEDLHLPGDADCSGAIQAGMPGPPTGSHRLPGLSPVHRAGRVRPVLGGLVDPLALAWFPDGSQITVVHDLGTTGSQLVNSELRILDLRRIQGPTP